MTQTHALIIDDNAKNVVVLARLLAEQEMTSTQLTNPTLLEARLADMPALNVIFLDLEMPNVDGFQVLRRFKADARFNAVPVIAYTVHISEIHVAHASGFDGFIGKPIDPDKFPDQLERILRGEPVWETA